MQAGAQANGLAGKTAGERCTEVGNTVEKDRFEISSAVFMLHRKADFYNTITSPSRPSPTRLSFEYLGFE